MFRRALIASSALLIASPALAQTQLPPLFGSRPGLSSPVDQFGAPFGVQGNPFHMTCDSGCSGGGGGGGAVTAASGSYVAGSIVDLGTGASPAANTVNYNLNRVVSALGTPLQAGGSIICASGCYQATQPVSGTVTANQGGAPWSDVTSPVAVTVTDRGGTITTGGTAQQLAALNASRKTLTVQNPCSATEDLYVSSTGTAVIPAGAPDDADLPACGSWSANVGGTVKQGAISVIAATTNHAFLAKESQ